VPSGPHADVALDPEAVLERIAAPVEAWAGVRPERCRALVLKQSRSRLVVRYDLEAGDRQLSLVGKWFADERGAEVAEALQVVRNNRFGGPEVAVPAPIAYLPDLRALFVEAVEGQVLRVLLQADPPVAARAGVWLAAFHRSPVTSPRSCGPDAQVREVERWAGESPELGRMAAALTEALSSLPDPAQPVHHDYHPAQVVVPPSGPTFVLDLDEAGLGDPAYDVAHFEAHLELLSLQWFEGPDGNRAARHAFRAGYGDSIPEPAPALRALAWFKLARNLLTGGAPESHSEHAAAAVERLLARV
jgi:aminoglycoside phosphotransferase (APT) family kinase protein